MNTTPAQTPAPTMRDLVVAVDRLAAAFIVLDVVLARLPARDPWTPSSPVVTKAPEVLQ